jgi:hypothetical protein
MTRILFIILFFSLSCPNSIYGQSSAGTNLRVELQSIQSIKINEGQNEVAVTLASASDYTNGKSSVQPDHIQIMSNSDYEIKVSAATNLIGTGGTIDIGTVQLTPSQGSLGLPSTALQLNPVALALSENTLVHSSQGDAQRSFDVKYKVSGGESYLNMPPGSYSTLVTYTILSQ